jgi:N-acetylmuramoyl-L-alanine amidase
MRMWALWALLASPAGAELPLVVIDPGHGGELDGAVGVCGAREDEVTLSIAREMAAVLGASGQARVLLTRQADLNVPLEERSAIANAAGAALFISVHANASTRAESRGLETYFLSQRAADRRAALVAAR